MTPWSLVYDEFDPAQEGLQEALCTLGNGYFATRGAAPEAAADDVHYPGTYVAGLYNRLGTEMSGRVIVNEDLVNVPNWLVMRVRLHDRWLALADVEILDYRRELDIRRGLLVRHVEFRDAAGRETVLTERRIVSMDDPHVGAQQVTVLARNWSGPVTVRSGIDAGVTNSGVVRYRQLASSHLEILETGADGDLVFAKVQTTQSEVRVAQVARTKVRAAGQERKGLRAVLDAGGVIAHDIAIDLSEGEPVTVEKVVALHTSRDAAIADSLLDARTRAERAGDFEALLERHVLAWNQLWRRFDITIDGHERTQMIVRLHLFHLLQTTSKHTIALDVGVPARGWHGEAYRGHIFWDELFIFPVLNLRLPVITRSLLLYRYRRLDEARFGARAEGHPGAMYPWQSGSNGREETQQVHLNPNSGRWLPDHSHLQRHIDIAIAWNIWQYFEVTGDVAFLRHYGAPMLIEIARFLASLADYDAAGDRYEIRGVMGPDEYHDAYPDSDEPGLDNNAYTNVMTVWVLLRALAVLDDVAPYQRSELEQQLAVTPQELDRWGDITRKMFVPFHDDDTGSVLSQFQGYENLEEFDWDGYRSKYGNISRLDRILEAEGDSPNRYRLSKQADALMLFYLLSGVELGQLMERLGYSFDEGLMRRTIDYYAARTSHGSTLSNVVHSWVLARADRRRSFEFFEAALEADISDVQGGTTAEGIHLGAMAGSVDLLLRGYGGIETRDDVLRFNPKLPEELETVVFSLSYRGQQLTVTIGQERVLVSSEPGPAPPVRLAVREHLTSLAAGNSVDVPLD